MNVCARWLMTRHLSWTHLWVNVSFLIFFYPHAASMQPSEGENTPFLLPPVCPYCVIWLFGHVVMLQWNKSSPVNQFALTLHQLDSVNKSFCGRERCSLLCSPHITPPQSGAEIVQDCLEKIPSACELQAPASSAMSCFINKRNYSPD